MGTILSDCDLEFWKCTVEDYYKTTGEQVKLYSMWNESPKVDPYVDLLYDEPTVEALNGDEEFKFDGPFTLIGIVEEGDKEVTAEERGSLTTREGAMVWFARSAVEGIGAPAPKRGDVIEWQGRYYGIIKVSKQGELGNTLTFTKYACEMKLTQKFSPSRRIAGGDVTAP